MLTFKQGCYITRTNNKWEAVTPFRRREAVDMLHAIQMLTV